jgi:PAT family beta-lactamase induction signal transducer AmpG
MLYRLGEFAIVLVIKPYWVARGYSVAEIGTITTTIGATVVIIGAIAGGAFVARFGIYAALWWLGLAQVISNIGYAVVATLGAGRWGIYAASIAENLGYGLGNAAFLAFLMSICDRERAATEYALLTALFGVSRLVMGKYSGLLAQNLGYGPFFWLTVFLGLPALLLLPRARRVLA